MRSRRTLYQATGRRVYGRSVQVRHCPNIAFWQICHQLLRNSCSICQVRTTSPIRHRQCKYVTRLSHSHQG
eukprot:284817867_1